MGAATALLYGAVASHLPAEGRMAIVNATYDPLLKQFPAGLDVMQGFRPEAMALVAGGLPPVTAWGRSYGLIAIRPSKNKLQTLGWVADALDHLHDDGVLLLAAENAHGAKSLEKQLARVGAVSSESRSKCRLIALRKGQGIDAALCAQWRAEAAPRQQADSGLWSCPGLFSWEKPDAGSQLLLQYLPERLEGTGMDLCCGYGLLGCNLLARHAGIDRLHMIDADRLALAMAEKNSRADAQRVSMHWLDAANEAMPASMEWIVCNPPFHAGQMRDVDLGRMIIENGCRSLKRGGSLWLVANRKLPYERVLEQGLARVELVAQEQGYKIVVGER